ncbi:hypothetical protein T12_6633 [Trichinella patagoniensis]|uniref:Uncharacterized protein n=1 Tax=Trichinella patagoniensis TaxID=990121 RepID=A0A0V0ZPQ0_9BILA|nr:hypothetical protein T12_6633 [Trichinella patagoniensis]
MVATADANAYSGDAYSLQMGLLLGQCCTPYLNMTTNNKEKHYLLRSHNGWFVILISHSYQCSLFHWLMKIVKFQRSKFFEQSKQRIKFQGSAQQQLNLRNIFELKLKYETKTLAQ